MINVTIIVRKKYVFTTSLYYYHKQQVNVFYVEKIKVKSTCLTHNIVLIVFTAITVIYLQIDKKNLKKKKNCRIKGGDSELKFQLQTVK